MINQLKSWIDAIFSPFHSILDLAIEQLQNAQQVTAQGLNVGQYLSVFGDMSRPWQLVISSLLISLVVIGFLFILRAILRLYFAKKDAVKWW